MPGGIWLTLDERRRFGLPAPLVIIGDNGMGGWYAIDTCVCDEAGECPVVERFPGVSQKPKVAGDFGAFLRDQLESARD